MKKYLIKLSFVALLIMPFAFSGCILDALNTLTQNIPITQEFTVTNSTESSYSETETADLSNSSTYQKYSDKIDSITFAQAQFRTKNVSPSNMTGNVNLTLKDSNGNLLFTYPLGQITPAYYKTTPYQLKLSSAQIGLINNYLSTLSNKKFQATLSIDNISPTPYSLNAVIDIAFTMTVNTQ